MCSNTGLTLLNIVTIELIFVLSYIVADVDIEGEIVFRLVTPRKQKDGVLEANKKSNMGQPVTETGQNMTVGSPLECPYQYPEKRQMQAMLSNILNVLTKVFVRAQDLTDHRRKGGTRFRVVTKKNTEFFEHIYTNITMEYLKLNNSTSSRAIRSDQQRDPCAHQDEVKGMWKELLDKSIVLFRRSALQCIEEHLRLQARTQDHKVRDKLGQYLIRELSKVRENQLHLLCDKFQLCFNELL